MIHYNTTRTCYRFDITDDVTGAVTGAATCYSAGADFIAAVKRDQQAERFARFVEQDDPMFASEAGAVAVSEGGPPSVEHVTTDVPCATVWCDRPATVRYHGTPLCYGCGMEAEQHAREAPPVVETEHDPAAVRASILEQQVALVGTRVLWKRRIGRGAGSRIHDVPATVLKWNKARAVLRTDMNYVASVPHADIVALANWSSDTQEAA